MQRHERATTNAAEAGETRAAGVRRGRWQKARIFSMRLLLFLLFVASFCCSIVPWGRALARAVLILPALVTLSIPRPLLFFGETVQHKQMTLS